MKKMKRITTCEAENRLWDEEEMNVDLITDCMNVINIYPKVEFQKISSFGGAFTEASAHNYILMSEDRRKEMIEAYFGRSGLCYNAGRIHMNSCDFGLGNYTYVEEGDLELKTFDISHDEKEVIPLICDAMKTAKEAGNETLHFLMSPWSPPAFMKTNGDMNHGGKLKTECREAWAEYYTKFIKEYKKRGIAIDALTVQNEPEAIQTWDSCIYTAEEEAEFVADYLGPAMRKSGLADVGIFIWDHNKEALFDRYETSLKNEKVKQYIKGAAVHWYTGDHFESIELVKKEYPDTEVIFTEGCVEYSRFADTKETAKAEMYAHDMLGNLNAGISAFYDWNLFLDEKGGPNHVGNFCAAPVMCNTENDTFEKRLSYYYIGHFSRYIQAGAIRIGITRFSTDIEASAFKNPDGSLVVLVLNRSDKEQNIVIKEQGSGVSVRIAAHSISTFICQ